MAKKTKPYPQTIFIVMTGDMPTRYSGFEKVDHALKLIPERRMAIYKLDSVIDVEESVIIHPAPNEVTHDI